jgi:predicted RNA-binding protein with TRAM domain
VSVGDRLDVEIEDVGEQGDGIARVERGYVVFVPDASLGDRVTIEITRTQENFGFAEVVNPEPVTG